MPSFNLGSQLGITGFSDQLRRIDAALELSLTQAEPHISTPALRHVLAPSKRLRAGLVIAVATATGKPITDTIITACVAVELTHISSLVHDDIIDKAKTRRGIPTINAQEGVDQAIIVGDFLLAEACAQAARVSAEAARLAAEAMVMICNGQSLEVADQYTLGRSNEAMLTSIHGKTAMLYAAACQIGGVCAGASQSDLQALASYGENFGMAFQLIDDVLDLTSSEALLGKPVGNDIVEGVYTMPILLALQGPSRDSVQETLNSKQPPSRTFIQALIDEGVINETIARARQYNEQATTAIKSLAQPSSGLQTFPQAYLQWSLENLVAEPYRKASSRIS